jgi:hypothetical protein
MTPRRWVILLTILCLLVGYVSSYFHISRKRWEEYRQLNSLGFLYVPPSRLSDQPVGSWEREHRTLGIFYWPVNQVDVMFGGPHVVACMLQQIGPPK